MGPDGAFDRDLLAWSRDRAADVRDADGREHDVLAEARDDAARDRDLFSAVREQVMRDHLCADELRDGLAALRERWHQSEAGSNARYEQAVIDREMAETRTQMMREDVRGYLDASGRDRIEAAADREASRQDRVRSARIREGSLADREAAEGDREYAEGRRAQAEIDRNTDPVHTDGAQ